MKRFTQDLAAALPVTDAIFTGEVRKQDIVTDDNAPALRVTSVTFRDGARNRWHRHTTEQVLVITHGQGIVANDEGELPVTVGDMILIEPDERHWHGAQAGTDMTHLSILLPGVMTVEEP